MRYTLPMSKKGPTILERRFVPKGSVFIKEGDQAFSAFVIQSGKVSVFSEHAGKTVELAKLGVGQICGEMALINEGVRTASVKAVEDCNLIVITRAAFEDKLNNSDITIQAVARMLIERIKSLNVDMLDKKGDISDVIMAVRTIYNNVLEDMDAKKGREFEYKVKPKLDALIDAIEHFS